MTKTHLVSPKVTRYVVLAAGLLALGGLGALGARDVAVESAQAQSFIVQGRAELGQGRRAEAIVSLERARLVAPRADFVRSALRAANVVDVEPWPTRAVNWLAPREWSALLVALGWGTGLSLAVGIVRAQNGRAARRLALGAGLLLVLSAAGAIESSVSSRALRVVSSATGVLVAPYQGSGATADLPPGVVLPVGARYGAFIQVCGPDGTHGWVAENALEPVVGS